MSSFNYPQIPLTDISVAYIHTYILYYLSFNKAFQRLLQKV